MGEPDPRLHPRTGQTQQVYTEFLTGLRRDDDPTTRAYPVNTTILEQLPALQPRPTRINQPDLQAHKHLMCLIVLGFFFLLRPAEYTYGQSEGRSQAFRFCDVFLHMDGKVYHGPDAPINDLSDIERITYAVLQFNDQKNAVRGEQVGHRPTDDPFLCPAKSLGWLIYHLRRAKAPPTTPLYRFFAPHAKSGHIDVTPAKITYALRRAAARTSATTGIEASCLSCRSLRPGGATALLCANVGADHIMLLGRWKSDAMFRYLRVQAAAATHHFASDMLRHGGFTFTPQHYHNGHPPAEVPATIAELLDHIELYDD